MKKTKPMSELYHLFDIRKTPQFAKLNFFACLSLAFASMAAAAVDSTCLYTVTVDFEMTKTTGHDKFSN